MLRFSCLLRPPNGTVDSQAAKEREKRETERERGGEGIDIGFGGKMLMF